MPLVFKFFFIIICYSVHALLAELENLIVEFAEYQTRCNFCKNITAIKLLPLLLFYLTIKTVSRAYLYFKCME